MAIQVVAEQEFHVGEPMALEGVAPKGELYVVFEDDGETGFFYALDPSVEGNSIQDAVHIYNVASVADREKPSVVAIGWSLDSKKAVLLINEYPHAVFDYANKQGYCRTGFPPPNIKGVWSLPGHAWSETAVKLFA